MRYWDQWRFPKKTRTARRDSVYYRKLQRSKATQFPTKTRDFLAMEASDMGAQMSVQDLNLFKSIPRKELFNRNFMEAETGPNFQFMVRKACVEIILFTVFFPLLFFVKVSQFNVVGGWVLAEVLHSDDVTQRAAVIAHFIDIADCCHEYNNFNSSYAIVAGKRNVVPIFFGFSVNCFQRIKSSANTEDEIDMGGSEQKSGQKI